MDEPVQPASTLALTRTVTRHARLESEAEEKNQQTSEEGKGCQRTEATKRQRESSAVLDN